MFLDHYSDLLKAISTQNFDTLELLCEETLTNELAASIYEWQTLNKFMMRVDEGQQKEECSV